MIWLIIGTVIVFIGLVLSIIKIVNDESYPLMPLAGSAVLVFTEGAVYASIKLVPWVLSWSANNATKISFIALALLFALWVILGALSLIGKAEYDAYTLAVLYSVIPAYDVTRKIAQYVFGGVLVSAVVCIVCALASSMLWQICLSVILSLGVLLFMLYNDPDRRWSREVAAHPGYHYFMGEWHRDMPDL